MVSSSLSSFFFQAGNLKASVKQNVGSGQDSGPKVGAYFLMGNLK